MQSITSEQLSRRLAGNLAWPGGVALAPPRDNVWWFWTFKANLKKGLRRLARATVFRLPRLCLLLASLADALGVKLKRVGEFLDNLADKCQRTALKIRTLLKH